LIEDQSADGGEDASGNQNSVPQFYQYSFENMHKKSTQEAQLRQAKKKQ
jgi:hypothetical protein